eukprot:COSAG04_NODE_14599_length_562_cov_0.719222_2_plen_122_part_00
MNTIAEMQGTLDEHKEALPTGAYVQLCNGLKQLHSVTKLYTVKYCEVTLEDHGDGERPGLSYHTASCIMRTGEQPRMDWYTVFQQYTLPTDLTCPSWGFAGAKTVVVGNKKIDQMNALTTH